MNYMEDIDGELLGKLIDELLAKMERDGIEYTKDNFEKLLREFNEKNREIIKQHTISQDHKVDTRISDDVNNLIGKFLRSKRGY